MGAKENRVGWMQTRIYEKQQGRQQLHIPRLDVACVSASSKATGTMLRRYQATADILLVHLTHRRNSCYLIHWIVERSIPEATNQGKYGQHRSYSKSIGFELVFGTLTPPSLSIEVC